MTQFDLHVMVDWSAASAPTRGRDSIWTAVRGSEHEPDGTRDACDLVNHATRASAAAHLAELVRANPGRRILVGIDVSLGLPAGAAAVIAPAWPTWRGVWDVVTGLLDDDHRNRNNRFEVGAELNRRLGATEGPFWGCPNGREIADLHPTRPALWTLPEYREVERALRSAGRRPFSTWQLAYAGSVGGQTLTAMPALSRLAALYPQRVRIWPFETGLEPAPARECEDAVVSAEIWPSAFEIDRDRHAVLDAAQVAHVSAAMATADRGGELARWFAPPILHDRTVLDEEGWVLGVGADGSVPWRA
ncbi:molybdopterin-guanine dinucleotide biosynthesis protein A [soil metagenome]